MRISICNVLKLCRLYNLKLGKLKVKMDEILNFVSGYGGDCPEGIPVEFGLLSILAAFGVAFGVLYIALTMQIGRRKKRNVSPEDLDTCGHADATFQSFYGCHINNFMSEEEGGIFYRIADVLWHGE